MMTTDAAKKDDFCKTNTGVVIIGGGIAGISAARRLYNANIKKFLILEATDKLGGRIRSCDQDGIKLDLGATWIHGSRHNPVYDIAKDAGLLQPKVHNARNKFSQSNKKVVYRSRMLHLREDGSAIPGRIVNEVLREFHNAYVKAEACFTEGMPNGTHDIGVETFFRDAFKEYLANYTGDDFSDRQIVLEHRLKWETGISGCHSMDEVSTLQFGSYQELQGHQPRVCNGFATITEHLTSSLPGECILLNHAVVKVIWDNAEHVQVQCDNGATFNCDFVIVSSSLGHLKKYHKDMFQPSLSVAKQDCLEKLAIGTVDKVFLVFEDLSFLPADVNKLDFMWNKHCMESKPIEEVWYKKLHSLTTDPFHPNVLMGFITGKEAEYMESMTDEQIAQDCAKILRQFLNDDAIPVPQKVIRSKWYRNQYTCGSYSYIPVGATIRDVNTLAEPELNVNGKMRVLFAGEATHPHFYSTTHGALLSGEREAERVINAIQETTQTC